MARWGDERTIHFIHLYREYECLWKPTSSLYKNKIARTNAYSKLHEELNMTEKEIKNKIKSLRSTYHQEKNKVENPKRSGAGSGADIYKPSTTWSKEMDFIDECFEYRNSIQTAVVKRSSPMSTETETLPSHSQREQSASQTAQQSDQQSSSQTVNPPNIETTVAVDQSHSTAQASTVNEQALSPSLQDQSSHTATVPTVNQPHKTSQTKKKRIEQNETLTALQRLENIAIAINNPGSNEKQKDEFYYFGQSVAAQLRSFPLNNALDMQSKIQALLSTERSLLSTSYSLASTPYSNTSGGMEPLPPRSIYSQEITASANDQFMQEIPAQSNTIVNFTQESGQNIFSQAWNNA